MMRLPRLAQLVLVLLPVARAGPVGDDVDLAPAGRVVDELLGERIRLDAEHAQLG